MKTWEKIIAIIEGECTSFAFSVNPQGKIRTTAGDKNLAWNLKSRDPKKRKRAERLKYYYDYCEDLRQLSMVNKYDLGDTIAVHFILPFPPSYSGKKRKLLAGKPHLLKPDTDNMLKGFIDALAYEKKTGLEKYDKKRKKGDSNVWLKIAWKTWTEEKHGKIIVYDLESS